MLNSSALETEFGISSTAKQSNITIEFLDQYASKSWEQVLHYLVGARSSLNNPSTDISNLLRESGLMERIDRELQITSKGFQFLLQDMHVQVWALLLQYLDLPKAREVDRIEALKFLFQLASMQLGQCYSLESLNESQQSLLEKFIYLGLIYQKSGSATFYPTRLATSLVSGNEMEIHLRDQNGANSSNNENKGYILAETNFRVYAYTSSQLEIAILSLFVDLNSRFANMIVGVINRDSIRSALTRGISADQVYFD